MATESPYEKAKATLTTAGYPDLLDALLKRFDGATFDDPFDFIDEQVDKLRPADTVYMIFYDDGTLSHELASVTWTKRGGFADGPRVPIFRQWDWAARCGSPRRLNDTDAPAFVAAAKAAAAQELVFFCDSRTGSGLRIADNACACAGAAGDLRVHAVIGLPDTSTGASSGGPISCLSAAQTVNYVLQAKLASVTALPPRVFDDGPQRSVVEATMMAIHKGVTKKTDRLVLGCGPAEATAAALKTISEEGSKLAKTFTYQENPVVDPDMAEIMVAASEGMAGLEEIVGGGHVLPLGLPEPAPATAENPLPLPPPAVVPEDRPRVHLLCDGTSSEKVAGAIAPWPAHVTMSALRDAPKFPEESESYTDVVFLLDASSEAAVKRLEGFSMKFATMRAAVVLLMPPASGDNSAWGTALKCLHVAGNYGVRCLLTAPADGEPTKRAAAAVAALLDLVTRRSVTAISFFHSPHARQDIITPYVVGHSLEDAAGPVLPASAALLDTCEEDPKGVRKYAAQSIVVRTEDASLVPAVAAAASRKEEDIKKRTLAATLTYNSVVTHVVGKPRAKDAAVEVVAFTSHTPEVLGALYRSCMLGDVTDDLMGPHADTNDLISEVKMQMSAITLDDDTAYGDEDDE